jgi:hypothetical protein
MPSKVDALLMLYTESVLSYRKPNLQYYNCCASLFLIPEADRRLIMPLKLDRCNFWHFGGEFSLSGKFQCQCGVGVRSLEIPKPISARRGHHLVWNDPDFRQSSNAQIRTPGKPVSASPARVDKVSKTRQVEARLRWGNTCKSNMNNDLALIF